MPIGEAEACFISYRCVYDIEELPFRVITKLDFGITYNFLNIDMTDKKRAIYRTSFYDCRHHICRF